MCSCIEVNNWLGSRALIRQYPTLHFFSNMQHGETALMKAAEEGHLEVTSKLIDAKATVDTIDEVSVMCTA